MKEFGQKAKQILIERFGKDTMENGIPSNSNLGDKKGEFLDDR